MRLLIMGPPGAGKGTQAAHLAEWAGVPAISTGDILRANVSNGTVLGVQARHFMDAGEYVADSLTNSMVRSRIAEPDASHGFLLDGYPRTLAQVVELDAMLEAGGHVLDAVVALTVTSKSSCSGCCPVPWCSNAGTIPRRSSAVARRSLSTRPLPFLRSIAEEGCSCR